VPVPGDILATAIAASFGLKAKHPVRLENSKSRQLLEAARQSGSSVRDADRPRPDHLNALEEVFTKLKSLLRNSARTAEATWRCIGERPEAFALQECANCLRKPGYAWN
jgi:transposase